MTNVQQFLNQVISDVDGLNSVLITDRDGVHVLRAPDIESDQQSEQILTTIFSLTTDQTSKVEMLGECNHLIIVHEDQVVVQANYPPLVITLSAAPNANLTKLTALLEQLKKVLAATKDCIARCMEGQQ